MSSLNHITHIGLLLVANYKKCILPKILSKTGNLSKCTVNCKSKKADSYALHVKTYV